jgi:hypothetical protein
MVGEGLGHCFLLSRYWEEKLNLDIESTEFTEFIKSSP